MYFVVGISFIRKHQYLNCKLEIVWNLVYWLEKRMKTINLFAYKILLHVFGFYFSHYMNSLSLFFLDRILTNLTRNAQQKVHRWWKVENENLNIWMYFDMYFATLLNKQFLVVNKWIIWMYLTYVSYTLAMMWYEYY